MLRSPASRHRSLNPTLCPSVPLDIVQRHNDKSLSDEDASERAIMWREKSDELLDSLARERTGAAALCVAAFQVLAAEKAKGGMKLLYSSRSDKRKQKHKVERISPLTPSCRRVWRLGFF